jgi:hypothetical protein
MQKRKAPEGFNSEGFDHNEDQNWDEYQQRQFIIKSEIPPAAFKLTALHLFQIGTTPEVVTDQKTDKQQFRV